MRTLTDGVRWFDPLEMREGIACLCRGVKWADRCIERRREAGRHRPPRRAGGNPSGAHAMAWAPLRPGAPRRPAYCTVTVPVNAVLLVPFTLWTTVKV